MSMNPVSAPNNQNNPAYEAFNQVLRAMLSTSDKVSDLIFSPGRPPQVELLGELRPVRLQGLEMLTPAHTKSITDLLIGNNIVAREKLDKLGAADLSYSVVGFSRFRVNVFMQRGTCAIIMRVIPNRIPSFEELLLPPQLKEICDLKNGIVLVTGPTGSGKSSTLASIIDIINQRYFYHIVTIEDPIEFIHPHKSSTIHQRELYTDCPDFKSALRSGLRQAPKVILVGEMRDVETIDIAMEAAETGHLVLSTLHTIDAAKTIDRIIGVYPKSEEHVVRLRFAQSFRYIISQRLVPRSDRLGRLALIEILTSTQRTREYIERGESQSGGKTLVDAMKDGELEGMQTFDQVLEKYVRAGVISVQDGITYATNPGNFALAIADLTGMKSAKDAKIPMPQSDNSLPAGFER